ncbi:MAG TPA: lipase maturation factor family protein, partial [Opitutaceae bacterium]|nr:lipase maturation factor family protein [Opitutaceae bacterium]
MNSEDAPPLSPAEGWLTRFMILRLLGVVYAAAFLAAALQLVPLMGRHGLTPLNLYLGRVAEYFGSPGQGFLQLPSLFWFWHSDFALLAVSWTGFALGCAVAFGCANSLILLALWGLYMSIIHTGQVWYGYGWETQLLETGFLAVFLCPLLDARPFGRRAPPTPVIWLFRWLIFRIMLGSGLIKLRGDPAWRDLTALFYHFETQPLPNGLSRWFDFLPRGALRGGVVFNHLAELAAPFFVFGPRVLRRVGFASLVLLQVLILTTGNYGFFNVLAIVLCLSVLDDRDFRDLAMIVRRKGKATLEDEVPSGPAPARRWPMPRLVAVGIAGGVLAAVTGAQAMETAWPHAVILMPIQMLAQAIEP